jgi:hypothetical protein
MFSKDVAWYIENMNQISTFQKWIEIVRSDLPKQISGLIGSAAEEVVSELNNKKNVEGEFSAVHHDHGSWGFESYWALNDSFDHDKDVGAWIHAWLPKNIDWLTFEGDDLPELALCYYSSTKSKMKLVGEQISKAIKKLPSRVGTKVNRFDDSDFVCVKRPLSQEITANTLKDPKALLATLVPVFREFTEVVRPGLEIVHVK